jgi:hypothetical protein
MRWSWDDLMATPDHIRDLIATVMNEIAEEDRKRAQAK